LSAVADAAPPVTLAFGFTFFIGRADDFDFLTGMGTFS